MIENGLGFQLVPWQPLLEKRIGQHITGLPRDDGGIKWTSLWWSQRRRACSHQLGQTTARSKRASE
jgi:Protein of unknown function (DUF3363)